MGAVNGHFHDIGKNLVIMMIESDAYTTNVASAAQKAKEFAQIAP